MSPKIIVEDGVQYTEEEYKEYQKQLKEMSEPPSPDLTIAEEMEVNKMLSIDDDNKPDWLGGTETEEKFWSHTD